MKEYPMLSQALSKDLDRARSGARSLRSAPLDARNRVLRELSDLLGSRMESILAANAEDLAALSSDAAPAFRDRLALDPKRIEGMRESLRQVEALPDPVGEEVESQVLANGLKTRRVRAPLGVILMIFESRPNVAIEAFSLAVKSGNALILRGGKESKETTRALYRLIGDALKNAGLPEGAFLGITDPDRSIVSALLRERSRIDVVLPRGGDGLIQFVVENSLIPIIKNDRGLCHIYVHEDADIERAALIVENAKTQRPGVCNAMETLLVHSSVLDRVFEALAQRPAMSKVEFRACADSLPALVKRFGGKAIAASEADFDEEHLDLILNVKAVRSADEAIAHIERHGSRHSESILTADESLARKFQSEVDAAAVYWNASTRFTDGFELGLGGELGISTQKLHVRGPVGLKELTSVRWVIDGEGQIR